MLYPLPIEEDIRLEGGVYPLANAHLEWEHEGEINKVVRPTSVIVQRFASDPESCKAYCFPVVFWDLLPPVLIVEYIRIAREYIRVHDLPNRPLVVFVIADNTVPIEADRDVLVYRTSLQGGQRQPNEHCLPFLRWSTDPQVQARSLSNVVPAFDPLPSGGRPHVGFCGVPNSDERKALLLLLRESRNVRDDFILREKFHGHVVQQEGEEKGALQREEFRRNMALNQFNVCCRGVGNYSIRLYETLQAGRIPVLINSDMVFPFEDRIDWQDLVVQGHTPEEVLDNLRRWNRERDLVTQQRHSREIWQRYLSVEGFHETLMESLGQSTG